MLQRKFVKFSPDTKFIDKEDPKLQHDVESSLPQIHDQNVPTPYLIEIISATDLINPYFQNLDEKDSSQTRTLNDSITGVDLIKPYPTILQNGKDEDGIVPFVSVYHGKSWIHSTKKTVTTLKHSLDPVWTVETDSFFLFQPEKEFMLNDVNEAEDDDLIYLNQKTAKEDGRNILLFTVKDRKKVGHVELGRASISFSTILTHEEGSRIEIPLYNMNKSQRQNPSKRKQQTTLSIRYRKATETDIQFLSHSRVSTSRTNSSKNTPMCKHYKSLISPKLIKTNSKFRDEKSVGNTTYYVPIPPNPDYQPNNQFANDDKAEERQQWLTKEEVDTIIYEPSTSWTVLNGEGDFGQLYIEIIQCKDLFYRHKENGQDESTGKNDPFVTIVHEDAIVSTDALPNCNSPLFMPWSKRAFKFTMKHSYSPVFIGVFDYNDRKTGLGGLLTNKHSKRKRNYNEIGRCVISVQKLKPNVTYNMVYDLYQTTEVQKYKRVKVGSITIRIQVQWKDERKLFFDCMDPEPKQFTLNVPTKADIVNVNYTLHGNKDMMSFKTEHIYEMLDELMEYNHYYHLIRNTMTSLYWWKPTFVFGFCGRHFKFPLHSLILFIVLNIAVEFPQYNVSWFFAFTTYVMLWFLSIQRERLPAWQKPPLYSELLQKLLFGRSFTDKILQNQNKEEDNETYHSKRLKLEQHNDEKTLQFYQNLEQQWSNDEKEKKEYKFMMNQKTSMNKVSSRFKLENVSKAALYSMQLNLWEVVLFMRFVDRILTWDHLYISFWISTVGGMLSVFTAVSIWSFNGWLWFQRIILWIFLGPWNYFIYKKYHKSHRVSKYEEYEERRRRWSMQSQKDQAEYVRKQIIRENDIKAAAMRKYMFGDFGVKVPDLWRRSERKPFFSVPQVASFTERRSMKELDDFIERSSGTNYVMGQTIG